MSSLTKLRTGDSSRLWLGPIVLATILATLIKLYLALFTAGSADVAGYVDYVAKIHEFGVRAYYYKGGVAPPGFGSQYVMWVMPWAVILGLWPTIVYYAAGSVYTLMIYTCWAYSASSPFYCAPGVLFYPTLACRAAVVSLLIFHVRTIRNYTHVNP